jgi:hypothetical protein
MTQRTLTPEQKLANLRRELAAVEDSLASPVLEGRAWDRRRAELLRQADVLQGHIRYFAFCVRLKKHAGK